MEKHPSPSSQKSFSFQDGLIIFFLILTGFLFLLMLIFLLQNKPVDEEPEILKIESRKARYHHFPQRIRHEPESLKAETFSPRFIQAENQNFYMPATKLPGPECISGQTEKLASTQQEITASYLLNISNIKKNDVFLSGFYDLMEKGGFIRSPQLRVRPSWEIIESAVNITLQLPPSPLKTTIQLPILLQGSITSSFSSSYSYNLDSTGLLQVSHQLEKESPDIIYIINRTKKPLTIDTSSEITPWLKQEFQDIPKEILAVLMQAKKSPQQAKLSAVAAILNAYFEYQSGITEIIKPPEKTWNQLLQEQINQSKKLAADCDVLAAYSYIYLKFLDIHPAFVLGYFNLTGQLSQLETAQLHATLYLTSQPEPLIFESTFFTPGTISSDSQDITSRDISPEDKELNYFLPSLQLLNQFQRNPKENPGKRLNRIWSIIETVYDSAKKTSFLVSAQFIYSASITITVISLAILIFILYKRGKK